MTGGLGKPGTPVYLAPAERLKHAYLVGGTGSGKTNLNMQAVTADLRSGRSICILDLRGDLVDRVLLRLATLPRTIADRRLVLIDFRDERFATPLNPLAGKGDDAYGRAMFVLAVLRREADSWGVQLEETLRNVLIALAASGWSLLEVEPLLSDQAFSSEVLASVEDPMVQAFFARYWQLTPAKQQEWRLPVLNKVTALLAIPRLRRAFGARECLSLRRLFDDSPGTILLVSLAIDRLHDAAHLAGGLIVSAFQSAMMGRVDIPERSRTPVMLYIDEFETMATQRFEQIVAEGRRFGVGLTLSHQNLGQIPPRLRDAIRNNVATQLFFQTGAVDAADLAQDVVSVYPKDSIVREMVSQKVGQAFLVRRGRPPAQIQVPRYTDPVVPEEAVEAVRAAGRRLAVQSEAIDAELRARRERFAPAGERGEPEPRKREWEVRYGRNNAFDT